MRLSWGGLRLALARAAGAGGAVRLILWRRGAAGVGARRAGVGGVEVVFAAVAPPLGRLHVAVFVVPVPPRVRFGLGVACGRVLPVLLASKRGHVEVAPDGTHCFVAAVVDEVSAEHFVAVAEEQVRAVPFLPPQARS